MRMPPAERRGQLPYTTWYEPHDLQEAVDRAVWFVLSQPGVTAIASAGDVHILPRVLEATRRLHRLSDAEQEAIIAAAEPTHSVFA
jgi:hypothetical protein